MKVIVWDLDGTLCDNSHRLHYLDAEKIDWDAYLDECDKDLLIDPTARLLASVDRRIVNIFLTGRNESARYKTKTWITKHLGIMTNPVSLIMRPIGDHCTNVVFKRRELGKLKQAYDIVLMIDDHPGISKVCEELSIPFLLVTAPTPHVRLYEWNKGELS